MRFYFIDTLDLGSNAQAESSITTEYLGYELDYANEATPLPMLAHSMKSGAPGKAKMLYEQEIADAKTPTAQLSNTRRILYWTGYPFAVAIGVKNALFEVAKMPFSTVAGLLFGRGNPLLLSGAEASDGVGCAPRGDRHEPYYYFAPGLVNLIAEVPLVGQIFQFNTGPKYMDWDKAPDPGRVREKVFLSRGIYGGDKWGQDTGLWATWARAAYQDYDIYSLPYRHGTITDVLGQCSTCRMGRPITRRLTSCVTQGKPIACTCPVTATACSGAQVPHESSQTMGTPCRKCLAWPASTWARPMWISAFPTPFRFF
jgi:hypothetical protein